jgi:long-chain acyl-CoA synthetase
MEKESQLIAKVYLSYEEIDSEYKIHRISEAKSREIVNEILSDLQIQVNARVNSFSRIRRIIEQREPFEKTPTQKIKRYLYSE